MCTKRLTTEEFIKRAEAFHNNRYDYGLVKYVNSRIKIVIMCKLHGKFLQAPYTHIQGAGCPTCAGKAKYNTEIALRKFKKAHGDRYDYSLVDYINTTTKVAIVCKVHGKFLQKPNNHLNGNNCPKCSSTANTTKEEYFMHCNKIHHDTYIYSSTIYTRMKDKIVVMCKEHGSFKVKAQHHFNGGGCPKCVLGVYGKPTLAKDAIFYRSILEANVADTLYNLKNKKVISSYHYETKIGLGKCTCDFTITFPNKLELLWLEVDGMGTSRNQEEIYIKTVNGKIIYSEKIQYYIDNNFNFEIIASSKDVYNIVNRHSLTEGKGDNTWLMDQVVD